MKRKLTKKPTSQQPIKQVSEKKEIANSDQEALRELVKKLIGGRSLQKGRSRSDLKREIFNLKQSALHAKYTGAEITKNKAVRRKQLAEDIFCQLEKAGDRIIDNTGKPIKRTKIFEMVSPLWDKSLKIKCPKQDSLYNYLKEYISRKKG